MDICSRELVEKALESIRKSVEKYLISNCLRVVSLAKVAMQSSVRIEFHGLYKYFTPSPEYPLFKDAYEYIVKCLGMDVEVDVHQRSFILREGYILVPVNVLEEVCMKLVKK